jgi:UDP-N-acetylglucosamine 4,6-dehydratase
MRITDLANVMAPGLKQETIGIRPGEKLHEVLITEDDARNTLELDDRFIIEPNFAYWRTQNYVPRGAKRAAENFRYSSDSNTQWLDRDAFQALMKKA